MPTKGQLLTGKLGGDHRIPNSRDEGSIDGPSHHLPPGFLLTNLRTEPFVEKVLGSVTDRRDFYHQAEVTEGRARSNMLPFSFPQSSIFEGTHALSLYKQNVQSKKRRREACGDGSGRERQLEEAADGKTWLHPCFSSLFQGDHPFALRAHEEVLRLGGLLQPHRRLLGHAVFSVVKAGRGLDH